MESEISPGSRFRALTSSFSSSKQASRCKPPYAVPVRPLQEQNGQVVKRSATKSKADSATIYVGDLFPISADEFQQLCPINTCIFCTATCWQGKPRSLTKKLNAMIACAKAFAFSEREIWDRIRDEVRKKRDKTAAQMEREQRTMITLKALESRKRNELPLAAEELHEQALSRTRAVLEQPEHEAPLSQPYLSSALAERRTTYPRHTRISWKDEPLRYWNADIYGPACDFDGEILQNVQCK